MANKKTAALLGVALFLIIAFAIQFFSPNIADPDGFYHFAHGKIYRTEGMTFSDFPWTQFSVIKDLKADIWYGFHLFLIPFTYFKNEVFGIKFAGAIITFLTLLSFGWALKRLQIKWPALWPIIFTVAAPDVLYRLIMTRPHNFSLALAVLTFSFGISGGAWPLFVIGALASLLHLALAWLPILVILIASLARKLQKQTIEWKKIMAVTGGILAGLFLRPHPLAAAKLFYVQVVQLTLVKLNQIPLIFGRELKPTTEFIGFVRQVLPMLAILIAAFFVFLYLRKKLGSRDEVKEYRTTFAAGLILTTIFTLIATFLMRRSYDAMAAFGVITLSAIVSFYLFWLKTNKSKKTGPDIIAAPSKKILAGAIIIGGLWAANSVPLTITYMNQAWSPTYLKDVSLWLKDNTQSGEIVFNTRWDYFGGLFFWNQQNYYINGMDPIFSYAYSPELYWESHFIAADVGYTNTCPKIRCTAAEIVPIHESLAKHFGASFVLLRHIQNPKLYFYWLQEDKFPLVFDNGKEAVFKIPPL